VSPLLAAEYHVNFIIIKCRLNGIKKFVAASFSLQFLFFFSSFGFEKIRLISSMYEFIYFYLSFLLFNFMTVSMKLEQALV
jgi:hypothetical protein